VATPAKQRQTGVSVLVTLLVLLIIVVVFFTVGFVLARILI
jgi:hypothetical protein